MSFPRYPEYKNSGIAWLGEVPSHWQICAVKRLAHLQSGESITADLIEDAGEYPVFGGGGQRGYSSSYTHDGDFVLIGRQGALCGNVNYGRGKFWASEHSIVATPRMRLDTMWLGEMLRSMNLNQYSMSAAQPGLSVDAVGRLETCVPPVDEQRAIAAFLDRETAKIDALVAEQRRLMELLKEKRQAVISHAVTKGLNPDTHFKASGVEWLGEVPTHWTLKRLKHVSPFITVGIVVNPSTYVSVEGLPFLYGGDIREGVIDWENSRRISPEASSANTKTQLIAGDLLVVRVGAPGVTAVVPVECDGGNCASVMLIKRGAFNSHWLCYVMNTRIVRFQVEVVQYGAAQEQFNISHAVNFCVLEPPREEQDEIVRYLEVLCAELDDLSANAERSIRLLSERRAAIISAAVTGQIDVRGLSTSEAA